MKINSIQREMTHKQGSLTLRSESHKFREKNGMDMCDRGYNATYCGSFTGKSKTATTFADKILKSNWLQWITKYSQEHNISTSALIALVLAGIMRPATIMALPGQKDKEDKIYASGHAMASGIIGFVVSTAITSPFDESIKKVFGENSKFAGKKLKAMNEKIAELTSAKEAKTITDEAKKELKALTKKRDAMQTLVKNIPDWVIGVPRAILTIALIPPILKYVFGLEKKKKANPDSKPVETPKMDFVDKNVFKEIKGGAQ